MKEILRSLRIKNNYSQSAVADFLDISRQMYNKYENGSSEPSVKNIKKLCELYKVSADIFFQAATTENQSAGLYSTNYHKNDGMYVSSPSENYGTSVSSYETNKSLLQECLNLISLLKLNEQISLMSKLASVIEKQTCTQPQVVTTAEPILKQKKLKKIPDEKYNSLFSNDEAKKVRELSLLRIREILKNDELDWVFQK